MLRELVLEAASLERGGTTLSQKELSSLIDAAALQQLLGANQHDSMFCAHVNLSCLPGSSAWLAAHPVDDGRAIDSPLFQVALKRRVRAPIFQSEEYCPLCGEILDVWGDHALVCSCGGDRTIRHNAVRNVVYDEAVGAGTRPEREKAGLLPARPGADGLPANLNGAQGRRPADVWLPRGSSGQAEALDFAVSSGLQSELFRASADEPGFVFHRYEQMKRSYKDTAQICQAAGFKFTPFVFEAHGGGWSVASRKVVDWISRQAAAIQQEDPATVSFKIAQRISCTLHRENARAILRRQAARPVSSFQPSGWDNSSLQADF